MRYPVRKSIQLLFRSYVTNVILADKKWGGTLQSPQVYCTAIKKLLRLVKGRNGNKYKKITLFRNMGVPITTGK